MSKLFSILFLLLLLCINANCVCMFAKPNILKGAKCMSIALVNWSRSRKTSEAVQTWPEKNGRDWPRFGAADRLSSWVSLFSSARPIRRRLAAVCFIDFFSFSSSSVSRPLLLMKRYSRSICISRSNRATLFFDAESSGSTLKAPLSTSRLVRASETASNKVASAMIFAINCAHFQLQKEKSQKRAMWLDFSAEIVSFAFHSIVTSGRSFISFPFTSLFNFASSHIAFCDSAT